MHFFPIPYEDEILYSLIGRYHVKSGNVSVIHSIEDVFGTRNGITGMHFPTRIHTIAERFGPNSEKVANQLVDRHTLLPYYVAFKPKEVYEEIKNIMISSTGESLHMKLGLVSSSAKFYSHLMYCPECAKDERRKHKEAYWHREHQIYGVLICRKHLCKLVASPILRFGRNKQKAQMLDEETIIESKTTYFDEASTAILRGIADDVSYILNNKIHYTTKAIQNKLRILLYEHGYVRENNYIFMKRLKEDIHSMLGDKLLIMLQDDINLFWVENYIRKANVRIAPLKLILLLTFLDTTTKDFVQDLEDYERIDVKEYLQEVWDKKLKSLISQGASQRQIINELSSSRRTITGAIERLGITVVFKDNGGRRYNKPYNETMEFSIKEKAMKEHWLSLHEKRQTDSSNKIRKDNDYLYSWLHRYSKDWLKENYRKSKHCSNYRINWKKRDASYYSLVTMVIEDFKTTTHTRITWSTIGGELGISGWFNEKMKGMEKCKKIMRENIETVEEFQLRRLRIAALQLIDEGKVVTKNQLLDKSGVKERFITQLKTEFSEYDINVLGFRCLCEKA